MGKHWSASYIIHIWKACFYFVVIKSPRNISILFPFLFFFSYVSSKLPRCLIPPVKYNFRLHGLLSSMFTEVKTSVELRKLLQRTKVLRFRRAFCLFFSLIMPLFFFVIIFRQPHHQKSIPWHLVPVFISDGRWCQFTKEDAKKKSCLYLFA